MDWYETSEEQAAAMAEWARQQGLRYERYGRLPTASPLLEKGHSEVDQAEAFRATVGVDLRSFASGKPGSWAENLCTGTLPGGVEGTLAHFSYQVVTSDHRYTRSATVVLARVLDGIRVARDLDGRAEQPTVLEFEREYGPEHKTVEQDGVDWLIPAEEDEALVRAAVAGLPSRYWYSLRDGMVVVAVEHVKADREDVYQLALAASAFADGLRRVAREQRPLLPGDVLPEPRSTPYRDWTDAGADRVTWRDPPPDLDSAATGYAEVARRDPAARRRARRGRLILFAVFFPVALLTSGAVFGVFEGAAGSGKVSGVLAFVVIMGLGLLLMRFAGRGAAWEEAGFRKEVWGLAAFAREYARSRGMYLEDPDEFRRRFPMPLPGSPQRVMRGQLPGGAEGRVVLWRDRNVNKFVNMAIVAAPPAAAQPPYTATPTDHGWLVITEHVDRPGRTVARLDAVAAEASRLAKAAELS
jgi:hypothetical protein